MQSVQRVRHVSQQPNIPCVVCSIGTQSLSSASELVDSDTAYEVEAQPAGLVYMEDTCHVVDTCGDAAGVAAEEESPSRLVLRGHCRNLEVVEGPGISGQQVVIHPLRREREGG